MNLQYRHYLLTNLTNVIHDKWEPNSGSDRMKAGHPSDYYYKIQSGILRFKGLKLKVE